MQTGAIASNLLDNVIDFFIREIGNQLEGAPGMAWARTSGVLKVSPERGEESLATEFDDLLHCLEDVVDGVSGSPEERVLVHRCIDEASASAASLHQHVIEGSIESPLAIPFGGVVIEFFEDAVAQQQNVTATDPDLDTESALAH
ncbi:MAG: hypothetical protein ACT4TC_23255 [Myxococcaceae bacterium]